MNWQEELLNLYDKNRSQVGIMQYKEYTLKGKSVKESYVLLPMFHITVSAQVEVVIDASGNFLSASLVDESDKLTVVPVTEQSISRTSGVAPYPLCDKLIYIARDYASYTHEKAENVKGYYEAYMEELFKWHTSPYTHPKVDAIYTYLKNGEPVGDLVREGVIHLTDEGTFDANVKMQGAAQQDFFVRFIVRSKMGDSSPEACWKDISLQQAFEQYTLSLDHRKKAMDYLTGKEETVTYFHGKKIRNEGDMAKLFSSNDKTNYTFRGRFAQKEEAFAIGEETSYKLHNALRWIIRKQGHRFDTMTMVTWESNLVSMPAWDADTETIADYAPENELFSDDFIEETEPATTYPDENPITAEQFYRALDGYHSQVNHTSHMILLAFDAATSGRLSLVEYKTLDSARYLDHIAKWHEQCRWQHSKSKNGKKIVYEGIPGVRDITNILYGSDSKGVLTIPDKNGKRMYAVVSKRLLPCIWDGSPLPYDLMRLAVERASQPQKYSKRYLWEQVLSLACSFVKKYRYDQYKEEWTVALDTICKDRNYLYGRLLALADRVEYSTFDSEKDTGRVTNAKRYMSTFAHRPFSTWKIIEENIQPYFNKLSIAKRKYYENLMDEICQCFTPDDFANNTQLNGLYLLGFHSQSFAFKHYQKSE